jgi:hypothetical protein
VIVLVNQRAKAGLRGDEILSWRSASSSASPLRCRIGKFSGWCCPPDREKAVASARVGHFDRESLSIAGIAHIFKIAGCRLA